MKKKYFNLILILFIGFMNGCAEGVHDQGDNNSGKSHIKSDKGPPVN